MEYKNGVSVKDAFKKYMEKNPISISDQAKEFGISRSALSQYINKEYYNGESFEPTIKEFLIKIDFPAGETATSEVSEGKAFKTSFSVHRTKNFLSIIGGCEVAYRINGFGVISGPSGCGKTTALREYIKSKKDVVYIRADERMNVKTLLKQIKKALDLEGNVYNDYETMLEIVEELTNHHRMLIIDEADKLLGSFTVKKIEVLRSIWDMAKDDYGSPFPLVLVGMEELEYQLKGGRNSRKLAQVSSRVRPRISLKSVKENEIYEILENYNIAEDAKDYTVEICKEEDIGGLRTLRNILENSLQISEGGKITMKVVKEAAKMLLS